MIVARFPTAVAESPNEAAALLALLDAAAELRRGWITLFDHDYPPGLALAVLKLWCSARNLKIDETLPVESNKYLHILHAETGRIYIALHIKTEPPEAKP